MLSLARHKVKKTSSRLNCSQKELQRSMSRTRNKQRKKVRRQFRQKHSGGKNEHTAGEIREDTREWAGKTVHWEE